jgi:hypothetical protein
MQLSWISRSSLRQAIIDMVASKAMQIVDESRGIGSIHLISIGTRALHTTGSRSTIMPTHQGLGVLVGNQKKEISSHDRNARGGKPKASPSPTVLTGKQP